MPQDTYSVNIDGEWYDLQGDHEPTEAEARAAVGAGPSVEEKRSMRGRSGGTDDYAGPDTMFGGVMRGIGQNVKDFAIGTGKGLVDVVNPATYLKSYADISAAQSSDEWRKRGGNADGLPVMGAASFPQPEDLRQAYMAVQNAPDATLGGRVVGNVAGSLLLPSAVKGAGRLLTKAAPRVMDMALNRTRLDRLEFPDTGQRLVDMRIIPHGDNVEKAMTATEKALNAEISTAERYRPTVRGYLGEGTVEVPTGPAPTPSGGRIATPLADVSEFRHQNSSTKLQGMHPDNPVDPIFGQGGRSAAPESVADTITGPGVMVRQRSGIDADPPRGPKPTLDSPIGADPRGELHPSATPFKNGPGAADHMIDPQKIGEAAYNYAYTKGKLGGIGKVPGKEVRTLRAALAEYLAGNPDAMGVQAGLDQKRAYGQLGIFNKKVNAKPVSSEKKLFQTGVAKAQRQAVLDRVPVAEPLLKQEHDLLGALEAQQLRGSDPHVSRGVISTISDMTMPTVLGGGALLTDILGGAMQTSAPAVRAALLALMRSHAPDGQTPETGTR